MLFWYYGMMIGGRSHFPTLYGVMIANVVYLTGLTIYLDWLRNQGPDLLPKKTPKKPKVNPKQRPTPPRQKPRRWSNITCAGRLRYFLITKLCELVTLPIFQKIMYQFRKGAYFGCLMLPGTGRLRALRISLGPSIRRISETVIVIGPDYPL